MRLSVAFRHVLTVGTICLLTTACGGGPNRADLARQYYQEIKALRPYGSGETGYGLAPACSPGGCALAQREYHAQLHAIQARYGITTSVYNGALEAYAEAAAERVDRGEYTLLQADSAIQRVRAQILSEIQRLQALKRQADVAESASFWQRLYIQEQLFEGPRTIRCTTDYYRASATTRCY